MAATAFQEYIDHLLTVCKTTLSIEHAYTTLQLSHDNFRSAVEEGRISLPFVAVEIGEAVRVADLAPSAPTWRIPINLYYIAAPDAASDNGSALIDTMTSLFWAIEGADATMGVAFDHEAPRIGVGSTADISFINLNAPTLAARLSVAHYFSLPGKVIP